MQFLFHDQWSKKRVQRIVNLLGQDWFTGKKILELGACHGDIGIEFLKLGADVTFTDLRQENLDAVKDKLSLYHINPTIKIVDQSEKYNLESKFDLVLHLGVLYHIENWKQDLECALEHSNMMVLETTVNPAKSPDFRRKAITDDIVSKYEGKNSMYSYFCQESVETHLKKIGCNFIRLDNSELNTEWCLGTDNTYIRHVYDWNYETAPYYKKSHPYKNFHNVHYRRFWIVTR